MATTGSNVSLPAHQLGQQRQNVKDCTCCKVHHKMHCSNCCPKPDSKGEYAIKFFDSLFPAIIAIATLDASITFTVIVSDIPNPKHP
jgi:hypothetical protein